MMKNRITALLGHYSVQFLCRIILGGLFIYASLDKIAQPQDFARIIYDYRLLPDFLIHWVALFLPWFEMICGLLLVSGFMVRTPSILLGVLLMVFMAALSFNALRGLDISCGCFTVSDGDQGSLMGYVLRDMLFLIPALILIFFHQERMKKKEAA
jgi:uncharacterized membrane protein YphA (DoxX/SURF4 family)